MSLKKIIFTFIFLLIAIEATAQNSAQDLKPILQIDSQGHQGLVKELMFTKDGKQLVSASQDKTVRVWDVATGRLLRTIRGQISGSHGGKIFAAALSPDNRWLALGGWLDKTVGYDLKRLASIRIIDFQSGEIVRSLKGHESVIDGLTFGADSRTLISGSSDDTAIIWDVKTGQILSHLKGHTDAIYAVDISPDGWRAATGADDDTIRLWNIRSGGLIAELTGHTDDIPDATFTPDGRYLLTGSFDKSIRLWDAEDGRFIKVLATQDHRVESLSISSDSSKVLTGHGDGADGQVNRVFAIPSGKSITSFTKHDGIVVATAWAPKGNLVATAGGDKKTIYIWDAVTGKVKQQMEGAGSSVWHVGFSGNKIGWGQTWTSDTIKGQGKLTHQFDINQRILKPLKSDAVWRKASLKVGSTSINTLNGDINPTLHIMKHDKIVHTIVRDSSDGDDHRSITLNPKGTLAFSGASFGMLSAYSTATGKKMHEYEGHTGDVWAVAVSEDGKYLVSGANDQTVRLWNVATGENLMTIFHGSDDEWVAWTQEGFFDASPNGAKYIGYHLNRGWDKQADYVSVEQLYSAFYRPDLIQRKIAGEDLSQFAEAIDVNKVLAGGMPPTVAITFPETNMRSKKRDVTIRFNLCDQGGGIGATQLRLNGIVIGASGKDRGLKRKKNSRGSGRCLEQQRLISLQPGKNQISLSAFNSNGEIESRPATINLTYKGTAKRPDLHILALAVDNYRDGDLRLKYSKKDADALVAEFEQGGKKLYGKVHTYHLYDDQVRLEKVDKMFDKISKKARPEDVFVLYVAGHGVTSKADGNYYYLPVNFRYTSDEAVAEQAISNEFFQQNLAKIKAQKSLVLLDTCNSGAFSNIRTRGIEEKTAVARLVKATGRATLMASSRDQVALEGYKGHGVFTWSLLEAMSGKGYGDDNKLTINELADYVEETLPELTYQKYGYEQVPQRSLQGMNFPLGLR